MLSWILWSLAIVAGLALSILLVVLFLPVRFAADFRLGEGRPRGTFQVIVGVRWLFSLGFSSQESEPSVYHIGKLWPKRKKKPEHRDRKKKGSQEQHPDQHEMPPAGKPLVPREHEEATEEAGEPQPTGEFTPEPETREPDHFKKGPEDQREDITPVPGHRSGRGEPEPVHRHESGKIPEVPSQLRSAPPEEPEDAPEDRSEKPDRSSPADETHPGLDDMESVLSGDRFSEGSEEALHSPKTDYSQGCEPSEIDYEPRYLPLGDERYSDGSTSETRREDQDGAGSKSERKTRRKWRLFGGVRDRWTILNRMDKKRLGFHLVRKGALWTGMGQWLLRVFSSLFRLIAWNELRLHVTLGLQSPAEMGRVFGWWTAAQHALSLPEQKRLEVSMEPRFLQDSLALNGRIECSTSLFRLVRPAVVVLIGFPFGRITKALWEETDPVENAELLVEDDSE